MKPREFWVSEHGGGATIDWDGPPNYVKDYYLSGNKVFHVIEKSAYTDLLAQALLLRDALCDFSESDSHSTWQKGENTRIAFDKFIAETEGL